MRGVFSRLYAPDDDPADDERILADIAAAIQTPDFELPVDASRVTAEGLAVNVTRVLYRCPSCGTQEGLKLVRPVQHEQDRVLQLLLHVGHRRRLPARPGGRERQGRGRLDAAARVLRADPAHAPAPRSAARCVSGLRPDEQIYLISRPRFLFKQEKFPNLRVFAFGRAFLTEPAADLPHPDRHSALRARCAAIGALSVDPGDKLHFTYEGKLYRIPFRNESA